jgi:tripartite-type tricarboxylate transporter receptor subunit TctC
MRSKTTAAMFGILAGISQAGAQNWPTRPLTMVVPFAAGGAGDVVARILTPRLSEILGQPIVIENVGGAGGMTGAARVAKAPPDGYQLLLGSTGTHAHNQTLYKNPLYNAIKDFAPVALVAEQPTVLITRTDLPANDLRAFIAYAKANETKMQYGSAGVGSASHLACALLNSAIGVNITHVPYRSGPGATQDVIAGRIDYQCANSAPAIPQIEGKLVKPIAILAKNRSPSLPALASANEQGLANFEAVNWNAIFLPRDTPAAIVQKLHDGVVAAMNTAIVEQRMKEVGADLVEPERRSPKYLADFVASEIEKWAAPIKAAGMSGAQ